MKDTHVLVVDDDPKIRSLLRKCLEGEGYAVSEAECERCVLSALEEQQIDLITLDISLEDEDGFDVARSVRRRSNVPIIMVSGKNDVIDRVVGLEIGADDYITKPFHIREVIARVRSVLRRSELAAAQPVLPDVAAPVTAPRVGATYQFDGMTARVDQLTLTERDQNIAELTSGDFKLLQVFLEHPNRALSRDTIMDMLNGQEWTPLDRTVDNQVARLRKKIERDPAAPQLIKTVRGIGYIFAADVTRA